MRVLLLSDAHGNREALRAVLDDARGRGGWDEAWYLGDLVGMGPSPGWVVDAVYDSCEVCIQGNWDRYLLERTWTEELEELSEQRRWSFEDAAWCDARLDEAQRERIASGSPAVEVEREGLRLLLVHGVPGDDEKGLLEGDTREQLRDKIGDLDADVLLCGHTHRPMERLVELGGAHRRIVNPGSVGMPLDGDRRASYATMHLEGGAAVVEHHRVEYDVDAVVDELEMQRTSLGRATERVVRGLRTARAL
jgi:protein phosphatase